MSDRTLIYQLRWMCDLADAMRIATVPVASVRELIEWAESHGHIVPATDLNLWKETHGR